jgi:cytochrome c-type biogenesis protein CcsB
LTKINLNKLQERKIISNPSLAITSSHSITPNYHLEDRGLLKLIYFHKYKAVLINQIDYWSYRIIGIGFPLLTLGILSGAVWANEAWGSYWNWDPKETWALITWVIFAIYLHIRITKGWNGTKPALVALLGFFVVWMCYLGVNLLGKGLHSYGWLN